MTPPIPVQIDLPADFRTRDFIAYHLRDSTRTSECWHDDVLHKGIHWQSQPACLMLRFTNNQLVAWLDKATGDVDTTQLTDLLHKMLGLGQDITGFETMALAHPQLGSLVARQRGLRVPVAADPYEALVWAIVGQQISVQAALSIRRRFIQAAGQRHRNGLWCHPDARTVVTLSPDTLRQAGLSAAKARTLLAASSAIVEGDICLKGVSDPPTAQALRDQLISIRGIGPWTADYTLLRGYGWLDGSLHGDAAVRRSLKALLQHDTPVAADATRDWLLAFSPWKALAAAHLWAAQRLQA